MRTYFTGLLRWLLILSPGIAALAQTLAITGVRVIDPRSRSVAANQIVIVEGGMIRSVGKYDGRVPSGAREIRARGKYLIPGLWDSHVHLTKGGELALPLFVVNGVTSVRDLGSNLEEVVSWRLQIEAESRIGPRIRTSGQILESKANFERQLRDGGVEPYARIRIPVANPADARAAVQRLAKGGADLIKIRTAPDFETLLAAIGEAHRQGLRVAAHPVAPPEKLLEAKLDSAEHFLSFSSLSSRTAEARGNLFQGLAQSGFFMSTTISNIDHSILVPYEESRQRLNDSESKIDFRRKYVCGYLVEDWKEQVEEKKDGSYRELAKELPALYNDLKGLNAAGVPFLAGTDVAVVFMYPGFSLHDELALLVSRIGFSPMDALRAATHNPAVFFHDEKVMGGIEAGQRADLVLLDADPLEDIRNTRRIRGVVSRGHWLDRSSLDRMLKDVERSARSGCKSQGSALK